MAARGRPNEYDPAYVKKVDTYLQKCADEETEFWKTRGDKSDSYDRILKVNLPSMEGFALYLGVARSSLYLWKEQHSDFSDALEKILMEQQKRLVDKGLSGEYNATIAKLILSSNHGMKERTDVTSGDEKIFDDEHKEKADSAITEFLAGDPESRGPEGA